MNQNLRGSVIERFEQGRRHSHRLFASIREDAYFEKPIDLRHPIVFYEGHLAAFNVITLVKNALGRKGVDDRLEVLFARGIDPDDPAAASASAPAAWPSREQVAAYVTEADALVRAALKDAELDDPGQPLLRRAESVFCILEHEEMHQETLRYMLHRLPFEQKTQMLGGLSATAGVPVRRESVRISAGEATLGARRDEIVYGWDNEFPRNRVPVASFEIDSHPVTNAEFLEFLEAGGYRNSELWGDQWRWRAESATEHPLFWERRGGRWFWRGMHRLVPLPDAWPVWVSQAEASAYAKWRGGRLATEGEFHRAAFGEPGGGERLQPWGDDHPSFEFGNFGFELDDPEPVGSHPEGASAWGVHELVGNGWEWTSTPFAGFPGFTPQPSYPPYSSDFFDGKHFVMKGASPATATGLVRRSFRNWFRPNYPYVYAKFRVVRG